MMERNVKEYPLELSVVLVSFNTRQLVLENLGTLRQALRGFHESEIILVDNASGDGTVDAVKTSFPEVNLIQNSANVGFGAANNQGFALARGRYVLLLNTDAFIDSDAIKGMLDAMTDACVAVVSPQLINADGSLQMTAHVYPSALQLWENWMKPVRLICERNSQKRRNASRNSFSLRGGFLSGACLLIRRQALDECGTFDESFFFYCEEADLEYRMAERGWEGKLIKNASVKHLTGTSGARDRLRFTLLAEEGRLRFIFKHHGFQSLLMARLALIVGACVRLLIYCPERVRDLVQGKDPAFRWVFLTRLLKDSVAKFADKF